MKMDLKYGLFSKFKRMIMSDHLGIQAASLPLNPTPGWTKPRHAPSTSHHPRKEIQTEGMMRVRTSVYLPDDSEVTFCPSFPSVKLSQWHYLTLQRCLEDKKWIFGGTAMGIDNSSSEWNEEKDAHWLIWDLAWALIHFTLATEQPFEDSSE